MASSREIVVAKSTWRSEPDAIRQLLQLVNKLKRKKGSTKESKKQTKVKSLLDLPYDIIFEIFDYLHPIHSACLGLTCKAFYPIHWSLHPKIPLHTATLDYVWARYLAPFSNRRKHILAGLLIGWASPLIWSIEEDREKGKPHRGSCFMTKERHRELQAQGKKRFRFYV
ncbi:hypothetical protein V8E51_000222 [Hyaloscypha variabilis]